MIVQGSLQGTRSGATEPGFVRIHITRNARLPSDALKNTASNEHDAQRPRPRPGLNNSSASPLQLPLVSICAMLVYSPMPTENETKSQVECNHNSLERDQRSTSSMCRDSDSFGGRPGSVRRGAVSELLLDRKRRERVSRSRCVRYNCNVHIYELRKLTPSIQASGSLSLQKRHNDDFYIVRISRK